MRNAAMLLLVVAGCRADGAREAPVLAPSPTAGAPVTVAGGAAEAGSFNERVLALVDGYEAHGHGGYAWPAGPGSDGTTRDLVVGEAVVARGGEGNHCVGVTLEVFWRALDACDGGVAAALSPDDARDLKRRWYVPTLGGRGAAEAIVAHGLGAAVALADARPGDFVQAWNADETMGHSMIFLGADAGELRYWSSQPWTDGIDRSATALGDGGFDPARVYDARAACPGDRAGGDRAARR